MEEINPRLPPEIEHEIFVLAFHNDTKGQTTLLLVAKRVFEWLTPLLYNTVLISNEFMRLKYPGSTAIERHGHHVQNLLMMDRLSGRVVLPFETSHLSLSCPNVTNLAIWVGFLPPGCILDLPVRRLALERLGFLEDRFNNNVNLQDIQLVRWCSNITHLAVGSTLSKATNQLVVHFRALEYLMVFQGSDRYGLVSQALIGSPRLKVVVRLMGQVSEVEKTLVVPDAAEDIRIVTLDGYFVADWYRGTQGLDDIWDIAEKEVKRRKSDLILNRQDVPV